MLPPNHYLFIHLFVHSQFVMIQHRQSAININCSPFVFIFARFLYYYATVITIVEKGHQPQWTVLKIQLKFAIARVVEEVSLFYLFFHIVAIIKCSLNGPSFLDIYYWTFLYCYLRGQVHGSARAHLSKCCFSAGKCCIVHASNLSM